MRNMRRHCSFLLACVSHTMACARRECAVTRRMVGKRSFSTIRHQLFKKEDAYAQAEALWDNQGYSELFHQGGDILL